MRLSDVNFHPDKRILRQFAAAWLVFIGGLGIWRLFSRGVTKTSVALTVAGIAVGLIGLCAPRLIRIVYCGAIVLTFPIGWVVSNVLLAVLYYGVVTPIGLVFRLVKRDRLTLRRPRHETCWTARETVNGDAERYLRQF